VTLPISTPTSVAGVRARVADQRGWDWARWTPGRGGVTPACRRCWTDPELRERYADLMGWRDHLCETHRSRLS
jgi:hypothetical protein